MLKNFFLENKPKDQPSTEELIERGFSPQKGKVHVLLINPPSTISERYGRKDLGDVGGDMIPLGIACQEGYLREKGFGVTVINGEGKDGTVKIYWCIIPRRKLKSALQIIKKVNPDAYVTTDSANPTSLKK